MEELTTGQKEGRRREVGDLEMEEKEGGDIWA